MYSRMIAGSCATLRRSHRQSRFRPEGVNPPKGPFAACMAAKVGLHRRPRSVDGGDVTRAIRAGRHATEKPRVGRLPNSRRDSRNSARRIAACRTSSCGLQSPAQPWPASGSTSVTPGDIDHRCEVVHAQQQRLDQGLIREQPQPATANEHGEIARAPFGGRDCLRRR